MYYVLLDLLSKEKPDMIYHVKSVSYRDLTCHQLRFQKDGQPYGALSYSNGIWLYGFPLGPEPSKDGPLQLKTASLEDVAYVYRFRTHQEMMREPYMTEDKLARIYTSFDKRADETARQILSRYPLDVFESRFTMMPTPMIVATVGYGSSLYGVVSIDTFGRMGILAQTEEFSTSGLDVHALPEFSEMRCALYER